MNLLLALAITWMPPVERENGESLTMDELQEFRIYVENGDVVSLPVLMYQNNPPYEIIWEPDMPEPHCFRMTAVDIDARESRKSQLVCVDYNPQPPVITCQ